VDSGAPVDTGVVVVIVRSGLGAARATPVFYLSP
jgi:hypothetical protein